MNLLDGSLTFPQFQFLSVFKIRTRNFSSFQPHFAGDSRSKFIFIAIDVCLQNTLCISYPYFRENKQKTVMNINPPHGFMNTSASNFVYCRIVVGCQQRGNNGPVLRSQNPFVNISHSICVEKRDLCIGRVRNLVTFFYDFHYVGIKSRDLFACLIQDI